MGGYDLLPARRRPPQRPQQQPFITVRQDNYTEGARIGCAYSQAESTHLAIFTITHPFDVFHHCTIHIRSYELTRYNNMGII